MPKVSFTGNLQRWIDAPAVQVPGDTVRQALENVFAKHPLLRGYVLDDQGAVRRHVVVFVGGEAIQDRRQLSDAVAPNAEISVLQALSGG